LIGNLKLPTDLRINLVQELVKSTDCLADLTSAGKGESFCP
jgi:hypothetical protein